MAKGGDIIALGEGLQAQVAEVRKQLPVGMELIQVQDQPQAVTRCNSVPPQAPDHYDVSYWYHGVRHHVQTTQPPGPTIVVNGDGEPRL